MYYKLTGFYMLYFLYESFKLMSKTTLMQFTLLNTNNNIHVMDRHLIRNRTWFPNLCWRPASKSMMMASIYLKIRVIIPINAKFEKKTVVLLCRIIWISITPRIHLNQIGNVNFTLCDWISWLYIKKLPVPPYSCQSRLIVASPAL